MDIEPTCADVQPWHLPPHCGVAWPNVSSWNLSILTYKILEENGP